MMITGEPVIGPTGRPKHDFPVPEPLTTHGPARIIALVNQKGGVGKTTSSVNMGAALAGYGRKVLMVDFDPQGALSAGFGMNPHEMEVTIYNVLMERDVHVTVAIVKSEDTDIDLVPLDVNLSPAEVHI